MESQFNSPRSSPAEDHEETILRRLSPHDRDQPLPRYGREQQNGDSRSQSSASPEFPPDDYRSQPSQSLDNSPGAEDIRSTTTKPDHSEGSFSLMETTKPSDNGTLESQQTRQPTDSHVARMSGSSTILAPTELNGAQKSQKHEMVSSPRPTDRSLPPRGATEETVEDAFVAFILYCNPGVPLDTDTTELRKAFRTPPRSDGKTFGTFTLLELIRKLETGEIRTWTQLVLELGVEPPVAEKNQSVQKVQQYAVRLKRWLHAMHLDAFSAYCLGKYHGYYTQVPLPDTFNADYSRDGVPPEEDLALRALHPESRPKRGRRKAEKDNEPDDDETPSKRLRLDTSVPTASLEGYGPVHSALFPHSAMPPTAHPDFLERFVDHVDPWAAASAVTPADLAAYKATSSYPLPSTPGGQQFRWRLNAPDQTPTTPHPLSAITPSTVYPPDPGFSEPHSAIPPSSIGRPKVRRRHGPAVSSAWPSGVSSSTGKQRGRPPGNRSVRDGPYSTFPLHGKEKDGSALDPPNGTAASPPVVTHLGSMSSPHFPTPPIPPSEGGHLRPGEGRPSRLYLQVPHGNTHPIPQLPAVSSTDGAHPLHSTSTPPTRPPTTDLFTPSPHHLESQPLQRFNPPAYTVAELEQDIAVRFLQVEPEDRQAIAFDEAQALARVLVQSLRRLPSSSMHEHMFLGSAIAWLGASTSTSPVRRMMDGLRIRRTQAQTVVSANKNNHSSRPDGVRHDGQNTKHPLETLYELSWIVRQGPLSGMFSLTLSLPPPGDGPARPTTISEPESTGLGIIDIHAKDRFGSGAHRPSTPSSNHVGTANSSNPVNEAAGGIEHAHNSAPSRIGSSSVGESGVHMSGSALPTPHQGSLTLQSHDRSEVLALERKLRDKEEEISRLRRKVLDAVL